MGRGSAHPPARGLPTIEVPLQSISEVDTVYWFYGDADLPTVGTVIEHIPLIQAVGLSYPVILWE